VDIYASLLQLHFYSTENSLWDPKDFKMSEQRRFMEGGRAPMPILTAIRWVGCWVVL
jgi:hypothetical protein